MEQFTVNFIDKTQDFKLGNSTGGGITDHTQLTNIGVKTHATLDSEVGVNNAKISYTDATAVGLNTAKVGITPTQASDITTNNGKTGVTNEEQNTINTELEAGMTGEDLVLNVLSLTTAEYGAGTPIATTFYIITDA